MSNNDQTNYRYNWNERYLFIIVEWLAAAFMTHLLLKLNKAKALSDRLAVVTETPMILLVILPCVA